MTKIKFQIFKSQINPKKQIPIFKGSNFNVDFKFRYAPKSTLNQSLPVGTIIQGTDAKSKF